MNITDKLLDIVSGWDQVYQLGFSVFLVLTTVATALRLSRYVVVLFRGWPPLPKPENTQQS